MIKITPSENVTIVKWFFGYENRLEKEININIANIVFVEHEYDKNNIKYDHGSDLNGIADSKIEIAISSSGWECYNSLYLYFTDAQNEYHRILRELGISTKTTI